MSFKGTNSSIVTEDFDKGIDGSSALNSIPQGYASLAENVDLSQPGRVAKRAGYALYGQRLPTRTKQIVTDAGTATISLDVIPEITVSVTLYDNTGLNATATTDAMFFRPNDTGNTIFATLVTTRTITTDTVFMVVDSLGLEHYVQPIQVFVDTGNVKLLFPAYIKNWWTMAALNDTLGIIQIFRISSGLTHSRLFERDIAGLSVIQTAPFRVRVSFISTSVASEVQLGAVVLFETCLALSGGDALYGNVVDVGAEYFDVETPVATAATGMVDQSYFSMRYCNAKHIKYKSTNYDFDLSGVSHVKGGATFLFKLDDAANMTLSTSILSGNIPITSVKEVGFLYGTSVSAGISNLLSKYFDTTTGKDRVVCGVDGYIFSETDHPSPNIPTIQGLVYLGAKAVIQANTVNKTFSFPLPGADAVYKAGDTVYTNYADGTYATSTTSYGVTEDTFTVSSATATHLIVYSGTLQQYLLRQNTKWKFRRKSDTIHISSTSLHLPILSGMTIQYSVVNTLLPVYEIKDCDYTGATKSVLIDTVIEWGSDEYIISGPLFYPVSSDDSITYTTKQGTNVEVNAVSIERSTIMACGLSGIWRFNGEQVFNMRIPRIPPGFIRNIPGTGGYLQMTTKSDGSKSGRVYAFYITYSYSELVNGKLIEFSSGLNPVSTYSILSEQDDLKTERSKLVELQVPCIPRGIGLPADDIQIKVYRTLSGTLITEQSAEVALLERTVANQPDMPFITIIAGTAPKKDFNQSFYAPLYSSVVGENDLAEIKREVVDPPLCSILSTLEGRVLAASGYDHPYLNLICKDLYDTTDNSFKAHFEVMYAPQQINETAFRYMSCPCDTTTASGIGGASVTGFGGAGIPFQNIGVETYSIKSITYTDNSHLFKVTGATITSGNKYLLRLALGKKESLVGGTSDPFYNGWDMEGQVFDGTATSTQLSSQKKWTRAGASLPATVSPPVETVLVFEQVGTISTISPTNGLVIVGNTAKDAIGQIEFKLYSTISLTAGDFIILKGLGITGNVADATGKSLSFDRDLIFKVLSHDISGGFYTLLPLIKGTVTDTNFAPANLKSAISVSNAATGVICDPFSVFKLMANTARATTDWSISPTTAAVKITTSPAISPVAGDDVCLDGLPSEVPPGSGFNYNGSFKVVSFTTDTFVIEVTPPELAKGSLTQDFTSEANKGNLTWTKAIFAAVPGAMRVKLKPTTLAVDVEAGDYIYLITRGADYNSYCLALTGWFKVLKLSTNGTTWADNSLSVTDTIAGVEIEYKGTIDEYSITGISMTKAVFAGRSGDGITTQQVINVPIPVANYMDGSKDITGSIYAPIDGYTALERVMKRFSHAINCTVRDYCFSYWGGRKVGNIESAHPGNVMPTNGIKIMPHLNPDNTYKHRYYQGELTSTKFEPKWICTLQPECWRIEGSKRIDVTGDNYDPQEVYTVTEYRPSRMWYTNPTGTLYGQAFREISFDEFDSQDGERITGMAPFQTYSLLAKQNSLWRISFGGSITPSKQKVPGVVGAASHKNLIPTERGVFVLHDTGIYITDGGSCEPLYQTQRVFNSRVIQNRPLFPLTCGYHNAQSKIITLGVPLSDDDQSLTSEISGQLSFNYSLRNITLDTVTSGWSVNTNIPATSWIGIYNSVYFSSTDGSIFRVRTEKGPTIYSDQRAAIPMKVQTRYIFADNTIDGRFIRSLFFQFGKENGINMKIGMSWDFLKAYTQIQEFVMPADAFGSAPFGTSYFGCDKVMENRRKTPDTMRVNQFSLEFVDDTLDSGGEIYGLYVESGIMSTKLIGQGNTRT